MSKSLSDVTYEELLHLEVTEIAERKNLSIKDARKLKRKIQQRAKQSSLKVASNPSSSPTAASGTAASSHFVMPPLNKRMNRRPASQGGAAASAQRSPAATPVYSRKPKGGKPSPPSVAFQESELQFDDVTNIDDEPAGSFLSLSQAPNLASANASVAEAPIGGDDF